MGARSDCMKGKDVHGNFVLAVWNAQKAFEFKENSFFIGETRFSPKRDFILEHSSQTQFSGDMLQVIESLESQHPGCSVAVLYFKPGENEPRAVATRNKAKHH